MVAKVIAVSQGKGGVAKTTTAVNLAGALIELGFKVALGDWDVDKPDALLWSENGDSIDWVYKIDKDSPVQKIEKLKESYDVVVFDTPPNFEKSAFKAIMASDYVIIPTSTNALDQEAAKNTVEMVSYARKPFMLLMSKLKKGTRAGKETYEYVSEARGIFNSIIPERQAIAECPKHGKWVGQFAKGSDSHKQFAELAREVINWAGVECQARDVVEEGV